MQKPKRPRDSDSFETWERYSDELALWKIHGDGSNPDDEQQTRTDDRRRRGSAGRIAGAIITGAIGTYGVTTNPPQSGSAPLRDEARSSTQEERTSRARTQRGATRDQGSRNRGSGRS